MIFWATSIVLTIAAVLAVLMPFLRVGRRKEADSAHDLEVYRDQLAELDRDVARGAISAEEAESARAEIARRLIKADAELKTPVSERRLRNPTVTRGLGLATVLSVPLIAWGVYGLLGSPDVPDQPLHQRLARDPSQSTVAELVARAERQLQANPQDARGWDVLAPIYVSLGRFDDSIKAYRNAIRLDGSAARRQSGLGEALVGKAGGVVGTDAREAFEQALADEPGDPRARFYLAMAAAQDGRLAEAADQWTSLAGDLPEDSRVRIAASDAAAEARAKIGGTAEQGTMLSGPDASEAEAAASLPAGEQMAMIEAMVAGLDRKLRDNPRDPEGWKRLIRSYMVLQKTSEAADALARATEALGAQSSEAVNISKFAESIGVKSGTP